MKMGLFSRFMKKNRGDDKEKSSRTHSRRSGQQNGRTLPPVKWFEEKLKAGVEQIKQRNREVRQKRKENWGKRKNQKKSKTENADDEISNLLRNNNTTFSSASTNEEVLTKHENWMAEQKKSLNANEARMKPTQPSNNSWNNSSNSTSNINRNPDTKQTYNNNSSGAPETSSWFSNYFQGGVNRNGNDSNYKGKHKNEYKSNQWTRKEPDNTRAFPKTVSDNKWKVQSAGNNKNKAEYGNRTKNQSEPSKSVSRFSNQNKAVTSKNWNQTTTNSSRSSSAEKSTADVKAGNKASSSWINQNNNGGRTMGLRKRFSVKRNRSENNSPQTTPKLRSVGQVNQWKKPQASDVEKPKTAEQKKFSAAGKPANQKAVSWKKNNSKPSSQNQAKPKGFRNRFSVKRSLKGKSTNNSNQRNTSSKAVSTKVNQANNGSKLSRPKTVPSASNANKASSLKRKTAPAGKSKAGNSSNQSSKSTSAAERAKMWDQTLSERNSAQASNPFSSSFKGTTVVNKSDPNYGKPVEGSKSHQRMLDAAAWVEKEVEKLIGVMREKGDKTHQGHEVTFGVLFKTYENISDSLVGILMRAKKRNRVHFEHEGMLLYPQHADVIMIAFH